jgi:small-conductance mechanosensitive channel
VHVWLLFSMNRFDADKLGLIVKFVPFFWFFFSVNSVAMNVFNYVRLGRREWLNTLLMALFNTLGVILWLVVVYAGFFTTGHTLGESISWGLTSWVLWLMGMLVILPAATVGARIVYKATRNPYLPAVGIAILVTCMLCTRTLTTL